VNQLTVVWNALDGGETEIHSNILRIDVADGLWIRVAFGMQGPAQIVSELTLCEEPGRKAGGDVRGRFVIIPLDEFSTLVGVAMASDSPADLVPIRSRPAWTMLDHEPLPDSPGMVTARAADGEGLMIDFAPGPGGKDACVLHIYSLSKDRMPSEDRTKRPVLSIPRLSPEIITIAAR
jgi:hypothetical protein